MIRRVKKEVLPGLPDKVRLPIPLELGKEQRRLYDQMANEWLADLPDGMLTYAATKMGSCLRLRQILVTPKLVGDNETPSAAFDAMHQWVKENKREGKQSVIFTPFAQAIPYIQNHLGEHARADSVFIRGGQSIQSFRNQMDMWESGCDVMVVSIKMAESFDLSRGSRALFLGADWNPMVNEQAEDRLHRHGQEATVTCHYLNHKNTIDQHVFRVLEEKRSRMIQSVRAKDILFGIE